MSWVDFIQSRKLGSISEVGAEGGNQSSQIQKERLRCRTSLQMLASRQGEHTDAQIEVIRVKAGEQLGVKCFWHSGLDWTEKQIYGSGERPLKMAKAQSLGQKPTLIDPGFRAFGRLDLRYWQERRLENKLLPSLRESEEFVPGAHPQNNKHDKP